MIDPHKIQSLKDELKGLKVLWDWALACGDIVSVDNINKQIVDTQELIKQLELNNESK